MNGIKDSGYRLFKSFEHFSGRNGNGRRKTGDQVTSTDIHGHFFFSRICTSNVDLQFLSCLLTDQDVVLTADMLNDCFIELVARNLQGEVNYRFAEGDYGDIRRTASDIYDHGTAGLCDIDTGTDCGSDRLTDQEYVFRAGVTAGVLNGLLLNRSDDRRNADNDRRTEVRSTDALAYTADESLEHDLRYLKVGNNTVTKRTDGFYDTRSSTEHQAGALTYRENRTCLRINGYNGRLLKYYAFTANINKDTACAQIDSDIKS